jgi:hypothetical protein
MVLAPAAPTQVVLAPTQMVAEAPQAAQVVLVLDET